MEIKKYYQIQSSIDLQFFCEELYNKTYNNDRQTFINDLMNLIHSYADDVAKLVCRIAMKKKNKARYLTGKFSHILVFLKTILSDNLFQKMSLFSMGMK